MNRTSNSSARLALGCAALGLLLLGCPQMPGVGDSGMVEVDAGCSGVIGCVCVGTTCTTGECLGGSCVDCRRGEAACNCRANSTCNAGLRCTTGGQCETCPAGAMGCACGTGDTCDTGLLCTNGVCVTDTCVAGAAGCPCRTAGMSCDATLYCDSVSLCQTCSNDVLGCPCANGVCAGSTVCDTSSQLCRAPLTCAQQTCLPNQACTEVNGADAQCTPMTCLAGFKWNGTACVACVSTGCANEPSCNDLDGGLGSMCIAQNRECTAGACSTCLSGFTPNTAGVCVRLPACGAATCTITQYCDLSGAVPTCAAFPCPAGQALTNGGVCTACAPVPNCNAAGFSGRTWPIKTAADVCLCETLDDYFIIAGGQVTATRCDADNDGWVREEAGDPSVALDRALSANERCNTTQVNRVRLFDEFGISIDMLSCTEGMVRASLGLSDGGTPNGGLPLLPDGGLARGADGGVGDAGSLCSSFLPLRLLETARNDLPGNPSGSRAPVYGGGANGRLLEAAELNSLTKACITLAADYNDNKLDDIAEIQGAVAPVNLRAPPAVDRARLESFAYFLELNSASAEGGVLSIRERSRCEAAFPFHYDPDAGSPASNDQYTLANDKPYWRSCARNRDPNYSGNTPTAGFDFGQFNCSQTSLSCPLLPPAHPTRVAPVDPRVVKFRDHGLCRMGGSLPLDGLWRGMNHHSQFKCVNVVTGTTTPNTFDRFAADFSTANGKLTFNNCAARPCPTPGALSCSSPQGQGAQTRQPVIDCQALPGAGTNVGFAAVNYRPYRFSSMPEAYPAAFYLGGCVNEDDAWWSFLCPSPEFSLSRALSDAQFGRYSCYKFGSNFVWADANNANDRATLRWGGNTNSSVLGPRPPPPDGGL